MSLTPTDRDLLIRIDANLKNLLEKQVDHEKEDKEKFEQIEKRLGWMEKICYGVTGCIFLIEIATRFI